MDATDLRSCSDVFLRTIEEYGFTGSWHWSFASGEQYWSPGLFQLLGFDPAVTVASYALLVDLLHPDDRKQLASPSEIVQGHVSPVATVRLIRPTGDMRVLSILSELNVSADGRPHSLSGVALDVTDRERLRRMHAAEEQRRQALYRLSYATTYTVGADHLHNFPVEVSRVHGLSPGEISRDPFAMIVPEERAAFRDRAKAVLNPHTHFQGTARERLANRETWQFRIIGVPLWDAAGRYLGRAGVKYPVHASGAAVHAADVPRDNRVRCALEQMVRGHHLRAGRGLLDWSMAQLAEAGGLSLSTVRRLEGDIEGQGARSRHKAVTALRQAGIRFIAMDDGTLALARS